MAVARRRARTRSRIGLRVAYGGSHLPAAARSTYAMRAAKSAGEPLELRHGERPWFRFALAFFIAAIWSVTLSSIGPSYERVQAGLDGIGLVHGLVILFVVGVQAFLAFTALRTLLQALTPDPRLVLSTGRLTPGGETELSWSLPGRFRRPRNVTLTLEGRALRTGGSGDEGVELTTFYTDELCRHEHATKGVLPLEIPADARPSESSPQFEIQWLVRFRGELPRWPDLERSYVLWVQPAEEARQAA